MGKNVEELRIRITFTMMEVLDGYGHFDWKIIQIYQFVIIGM